MATVLRKSVPVSAPQYRIPRKGTRAKVYNGNQAMEVAVATFDPSANTGQRAIAAHGLGVFIPAKAVVTKVLVDVVTTFTSANDSATIALSAQDANDIVSAIAISAAGDVWDAGVRGSKIGFPNFGADAAHDSALKVAALFAGTAVKTTAERELTATVAVQALTAGKATIYCEYFLSS